ncbi:hypothetical protein [Paeniglutamicibacter sp.]|uniref:hypothetical protein n=1 Tax=Paeniglutamicibacter sp. TaxID=1934391 RepID=UPI00398A24FE
MSQDTSVEAALFNVESIHHIHGQECLCGFKSAVSRDRTKHIMDVTLAAAAANRERETLSRLNRDLIRDCANLTKRAETADRRNKGILAELSASGGRNIDLRQRAEAAETKVDAVREALEDVRRRGEAIQLNPNNGSIRHQERHARADGYREAAQLGLNALCRGA